MLLKSSNPDVMKKYLLILYCLLFLGTVLGQDTLIFKEDAKVAPLQKHNEVLSAFGGLLRSSIGFVKDQGIEPYEYGKYLGNYISTSPKLISEPSFEGFINGLQYYLDCFLDDMDGSILTAKLADGSVLIKVPVGTVNRICTRWKNPTISREETLNCIRGLLEELADISESSITQKLTEEYLVFVIRRK